MFFMENKQITLREVYTQLKNLEQILKNKGIINEISSSEKESEIIWDWPEKVPIFADEKLLGEDWLSKEDEEAWKDL